MYDGDTYNNASYDVVIANEFFEGTKFPARTMEDLSRISKRFVVIVWKNLHNYTKVKKTDTGYNNVYCEKEMRILGNECGLRIKKKYTIDGGQIWLMEKM